MFRQPVLFFCAALVCCAAVRGAQADDVAILLSSEIIPYTACRDGIREHLADISLFTTTIGDDITRGRAAMEEIRRANPRVTIAVGPQAAFVLAQERTAGGRLFCMILNPQRLLSTAGMFPGVSLNIAPDFQMRTIRRAFPDRTRVGIFYSTAVNQETVDGLRAAADAVGLAVVPLPIVSAQDIPGRLTAPEPVCDLLLIIPDEKLGSTKIVEYIIKEALRRKLPVVGYNSWFARNGAVLSFVVDYKGVGRQTAALARRLLSGAAVPAATILPPEAVAVSVDLKTAEKIGVHLSAEIIGTAGEVQR